jgi:hypothetical protein
LHVIGLLAGNKGGDHALTISGSQRRVGVKS